MNKISPPRRAYFIRMWSDVWCFCKFGSTLRYHAIRQETWPPLPLPYECPSRFSPISFAFLIWVSEINLSWPSVRWGLHGKDHGNVKPSRVLRRLNSSTKPHPVGSKEAVATHNGYESNTILGGEIPRVLYGIGREVQYPCQKIWAGERGEKACYWL